MTVASRKDQTNGAGYVTDNQAVAKALNKTKEGGKTPVHFTAPPPPACQGICVSQGKYLPVSYRRTTGTVSYWYMWATNSP